MTTVAPDPHLLSVARRVLSQHQFRVQESQLNDLEGASWLLAESEYFVLGVAAGQTFDDLLLMEGYVTATVGELLTRRSVGAKRWDSYVVLLSSSGRDERGRPDVVRVQHNTRSMRRIVCLGTAAQDDAMADALATFLPLPDPPAGGLPSAFDELVRQLVINGIAEDEAAGVVATYRSTEAIDGR
jgi:hypothetical protein